MNKQAEGEIIIERIASAGLYITVSVMRGKVKNDLSRLMSWNALNMVGGSLFDAIMEELEDMMSGKRFIDA